MIDAESLPAQQPRFRRQRARPHARDFGRRLKKQSADFAGDEIRLVVGGDGDDDFGVLATGGAQGFGMRRAAKHSADIEPRLNLAQAFAFGVDQSQIGFADELLRERASDSPRAENDNVH